MTNKEYAQKILRIIGNVTVSSDAIYQLAKDAYHKLGGSETEPDLDTIYQYLKAAIDIYDETDDLNITENGTYELLGKNIEVNVGGGKDDRFRFEAIGKASFGFNKIGSLSLYWYSLDGENWTPITNTSTTISMNNEDVVYVRGKINQNFSSSNNTQFRMTGNIKAKGNIMYLYDYENLTDVITYNYAFGHLFQGCSSLITAPELPATTLANYCYDWMFYGCANLVEAPALPATTLADYCYDYMFYGCSRLVEAPELPATTLTYSCYQCMFSNCSNLVNAPELPATTLANNCYQNMFHSCANLVEAPELPATTLAYACYSFMFAYCRKLKYVKCFAETVPQNTCNGWLMYVASTGDFYNLGGADFPSGASGIPTGWTEHTSL